MYLKKYVKSSSVKVVQVLYHFVLDLPSYWLIALTNKFWLKQWRKTSKKSKWFSGFVIQLFTAHEADEYRFQPSPSGSLLSVLLWETALKRL